MNTNNGALSFDAYINDTNFKRQLDEMERRIVGLTDSTIKEADKMDAAFKKVGTAVGAYFTFDALKGFGSELIKVRGEFQQLEVAFTTMLGSKEKADALMAQIVETAATTPFDLQGVASGAKQLLAYGTAADQVNGTLIRLGNIAAGLSIPLGDMVYLYGTTQTQGRLYTQDLNQFLGRGIPMVRELAKQFGVAEDEVKTLVEAGRVGFEEVQKVIESLTDKGGMFYNLMAEQSKTLSGQISNLEDAWSQMLNEIGKEQEGLLSGTISMASTLVENYDKVIDVLKVLVATYGAYKAAVIAANVAKQISIATTSGLTAAETLHYAALVITEKAQKALNKTMLANPYVLAATLLVGLITTVALYSKHATTAEKAQDNLTAAMKRSEDTLASERAKIETLTTIVKSETAAKAEKAKAIKDLIALSPDHLSGITEETIRTGEATSAIDKYIEARRRQIQIDEINKELTESIKRENEISSKKDSDFDTWFGYGGKVDRFFSNDPNFKKTGNGAANKANELRAEAEIQKQLKAELEKILSGPTSKEEPEIVNTVKTVKDRIKEIGNEIGELEKKRSPLAATDAKGIESVNKQIDKLNAEKNKLEGKESGKKDKSVTVNSLDYWEKMRDDAVKSLGSLSIKDANFASKQAALLATIKKAEENIASIERGQQSFNEQLDYKKKQYQLYYKWVEQIGKEAADTQFSALIAEGGTYIDYLNNQIAKLEAKRQSGSLTPDESNNLISLTEQRDDASGAKSGIEVFKEGLTRAKEEAGGLLEYLDKIKEKKEELNDDNSELGIQKKEALQTEENSTTAAIKDNVKELVSNYQTYAGQIRTIEESLNRDLKILYQGLQSAKTEEERNQIKDSITARKKSAKDETASVKAEVFEQSKSYQTLCEFITGQSKKTVFRRIADMQKALEKAKEAYGEESETYKQLVEEINSAKINLIADELGKTKDALFQASELAGMFDEDLATALATTGEIVGAMEDVAGAVASFSSGDIIGGVTGVLSAVTSLIGIGKRVKEENRKAREEVAKFDREVLLAGYEYNRMLRERLDLEKQIGETTLDYYNRKLKALQEQKAASQKEYDELWAKLQGEEYVESKGYKHGTWFRKAKTWNNMGSLSGKSYEEIEKLYTEGRLEENVAKMFEQLRALKEEGADVADIWEETIEDMRVAFTGITYDSLVDSILSAFETGKTGANDLSEFFGDMMKKSLLESFKMQYLEGPLREWYEKFAEYSQSDNQLSKEEIEALRAYYNSIMQTANDQYDAMKEASGLDWGSNTEDPLTGSVRQLTEETGSAVAGQMTMIRLIAAEHNETAKAQLIHLAEIAYNTSFCAHLAEIRSLLEVLASSSDSNSLRAKGIA